VASEGTEHRLAAVLMADVVGYSRLMAEDQDATVRTVTAYREEVELLVRQHRGQLVDFTGDNFLAEFASALYAVRCAVEIQSVLRARNAPLAADRRVEFRMGVHLADVQVEGERRFGTGVNVAARLEALAEPGGLCISAPVLEHVRGNLDLEFDDLGTKSVKNIPDPVRVYRVKLEAAPPKAAPGSLRRMALAVGAVVLVGAVAVTAWRLFEGSSVGPISAPIRSIAVLPLENLSGDPEQEYFADGMTEALIGDLAKIGSLRVISRTSVMQYKRAPKPLREIAKELDVDGIIEGTVMRDGDRVRITAQLIDGRSDSHLWSDSYDRELLDILALHREVARAVAEQVRVELDPEEQASLTAHRPVDPRAYDAYVRGLELGVSGGGTMLEAVAAFERAVELDPSFAQAYAWLATSRMILASQFLRPPDERAGMMPAAVDAASRALELDELQATAHSTIGMVRLLQWDFPAAGRSFERAVQLGPSDPGVLGSYLWYLLMMARFDEARRVAERLRVVAPFDHAHRSSVARAFFYTRDYERSVEENLRAQELNPAADIYYLPMAYGQLGRDQETHEWQLELSRRYARLGVPGRERMAEAQERGWAEGGIEGSWRAILEIQIELAAQGLYSPYAVAMGYARLGEIDPAFAWLERSYQAREAVLYDLKAQPFADALRSDPRFDDLLRRIGFPES
jgi:TolB-like protein/class 3 adenylate cyclase